MRNTIFLSTTFLPKAKEKKRMVRNDVFGDGEGRSMDFPSVCPCIRDALQITRALSNIMQLSNAK